MQASDSDAPTGDMIHQLAGTDAVARNTTDIDTRCPGKIDAAARADELVTRRGTRLDRIHIPIRRPAEGQSEGFFITRKPGQRRGVVIDLPKLLFRIEAREPGVIQTVVAEFHQRTVEKF